MKAQPTRAMTDHSLWPWQKTTQGRVFISYRRDDTQWAAGRLADSLGQYFGDDRVFRDVEDIGAGADFGEVIRGTLGSADAAIILIGNTWLTACDPDGRKRLDDPDDWVAGEIAAALEAGIPVYPVLVEGTTMPRGEELPERLRALARYNAVSISDNRWSSDVERLARIVALDIPSATERKLQGLNMLVSSALLLTVLITSVVVVSIIMAQIASDEPILAPSGGCLFGLDEFEATWLPTWLCTELSPESGAPKCLSTDKEWPLTLATSGLIFLAIVPCSVLLFVFAHLVDRARRSFFLAAAWAGAVGTLSLFLLLKPICDAYEPSSMYFGSMVTAMVVFALMNLSGFRAK